MIDGWLNRDRALAVAWLCAAASLIALTLLLATSHGTLDSAGRPLGTDFSNVWTAGRMALDGRASDAWIWNEHFAVQRALHGKADVDVFGWHYPPPFLLVAAVLASLPYLPALVMWQALTLAPLAVLMWRLVKRRETLLATLAAPVTLICLTHGHNGFLTALLLGGGLALLDRRPLVAGIMLGCLIYKPQFALIVPPLLIAGGHWRAIAGAALSSALLLAATLAVWGWPVWQAFLDSLPLTRSAVIEQGSTGWHKIMTPFAAVRMWGGSVSLAYAVQSVMTLAAAGAVTLFAFRAVPPDRRNALACAAVLVATPYAFDYDQVVLLPALAFLWRDGEQGNWREGDKTLMAFAWIAPLIARQAGETLLIPLGLLAPLAVATVALRRFRASPSRH